MQDDTENIKNAMEMKNWTERYAYWYIEWIESDQFWIPLKNRLKQL